MKLIQDGPQLLLGKVSALPVDDGRGGEVNDVGLDLLKMATEFVEMGIDLGTVIATAHPIESRRTGRRARPGPRDPNRGPAANGPGPGPLHRTYRSPSQLIRDLTPPPPTADHGPVEGPILPVNG